MFSQAKTFKLILLLINIFVKQTHCSPGGQVIERTILQGQKITLPCPLDTETSGGQVQWQRGGFGLGFDLADPGFTRFRYQRSEASCDLLIDPVTLEDHSDFTCSVFSGGKVQVASIVSLEVRQDLTTNAYINACAQVLVGVSQPQILQNTPVVMVEGDTVSLDT